MDCRLWSLTAEAVGSVSSCFSSPPALCLSLSLSLPLSVCCHFVSCVLFRYPPAPFAIFRLSSLAFPLLSRIASITSNSCSLLLCLDIKKPFLFLRLSHFASCTCTYSPSIILRLSRANPYRFPSFFDDYHHPQRLSIPPILSSSISLSYFRPVYIAQVCLRQPQPRLPH